jgi:hypothetical protein
LEAGNVKDKKKMIQTVESSIGKMQIDNSGSPIGAARMDPAEAYGAIPVLLKEYIESGSEKTWDEIRRRINNIYQTVSTSLEALDAETLFSKDAKILVKAGKKLFFKPNLVMLPSMDPQTHDPVLAGTCLPWEFLAAVMRWFHDQRGISYHQMALGEAGTFTSLAAYNMSKLWGGNPVTTQAVMEGKRGDKYGGWGFYFARKYLADSHDPKHSDNPMNGFEESLSGHSLPPGQVKDKLLIYDLNKIADDMSNGREVGVAGGINFQNITIHKAIVGGNPDDAQDLRNWPGCVLVNVAKLKIHLLELFTCAIKNLGIGLYPMEANDSSEPGKFHWKYAMPDLQIPLFKMRIPHSRWVVQYDENSLTPRQTADGGYVWRETGGMEANMADIIQAVKGQGISMIHVVDAIEATNINHSGPGAAALPEGFVFASKDVVAIDCCCSRYLFSMVPIAEADSVRRKYNLNSDVIQKVPMPEIRGKNIVNGEGYDSAFSRYGALRHCEERGLGQQRYYVAGNDLRQGGYLASLNQHLGRVEDGVFSDLMTTTMYHTANKPLWDLQATCLKYLELNDKLTGSEFKSQVLEAYDEDKDGVIDYLETGRGDSPVLMTYGASLMIQDLDPLLSLELRFLISATQLKRLKKDWSVEGHTLGEQTLLGQALALAFSMSNSKEDVPDPLFPGRRYGNGKWPSMQYVMQRQIANRIFGQKFPVQFDTIMSPYGCAFQYVDAKCNEGRYCTSQTVTQKEDVIGNYHREVARGGAPLPFTIYVPRGFGSISGAMILNVEETDDPKLVFTARFNGEESWNELRMSKYRLK